LKCRTNIILEPNQIKNLHFPKVPKKIKRLGRVNNKKIDVGSSSKDIPNDKI
jgi:hypothetical protein